ncbi:hypothetical protein Pfo_028952 [Paulownia fortunei]|nr:hypothetical protein Pfo_028952 [Paulownia fortunei]
MAEAVPAFRWNNLSSASLSICRLSPFHRHHSHGGRQTNATGSFSPKISCKAVEIEAAAPAAAEAKIKKSRYEMENLTTWLLKQEQAGHIDASSIINLTGAQGTVNIQGEDQKKLDVISNELFCNCLRSSGRTGIIASEEEDVPVAVKETYSGNYIVVFDPIDGSANIDTSLTTGSIFGIYGPDKQCLSTLMMISTLDQAEEKCIIMVFTLSIGRGVYAFTLDPAYGEFVLTHENIRIPNSGRFTPSMKNGNLRLLYECAPMSYLIEQAGGKAIDGCQRILDITPAQDSNHDFCFADSSAHSNIHGSPDEVEKLEVFVLSVCLYCRLSNF